MNRKQISVDQAAWEYERMDYSQDIKKAFKAGAEFKQIEIDEFVKMLEEVRLRIGRSFESSVMNNCLSNICEDIDKFLVQHCG